MAQSSLTTEAQRAYLSGDLDTAKQKFKAILVQDPTNMTARNYIMAIALDERSAGKNKQSKELKALIVPKVEFKDSLSAALEHLKQEAVKISDGEVQPNFVLKPGVNAVAPFTLQLTNMSFFDVLHYIGNLTNVQFSVEPYAIVVKPKS